QTLGRWRRATWNRGAVPHARAVLRGGEPPDRDRRSLGGLSGEPLGAGSGRYSNPVPAADGCSGRDPRGSPHPRPAQKKGRPEGRPFLRLTRLRRYLASSPEVDSISWASSSSSSAKERPKPSTGASTPSTPSSAARSSSSSRSSSLGGSIATAGSIATVR